LKGKVLFFKTFADFIVADFEFLKAVFPEIQTAWRNGISDFRSHTGTIFSLPYSRPGKEGEDSTRRTCFISKIEMIGLRVIKVYRFFNQTQTEGFGIKIVVALCVSGNRCDVVET